MVAQATELSANAFERVATLRESVEAGAFWGAVLLPAAYVPLLATGIDGVEPVSALSALVCAHFVLLTVGHTHGR